MSEVFYDFVALFVICMFIFSKSNVHNSSILFYTVTHSLILLFVILYQVGDVYAILHWNIR